MTKSRSFFVNCHKVIRSVASYQKKSKKWSYGQVEGSFGTTAGKKLTKSHNFSAPCPKLTKNRFSPKNSFFSRKQSSGYIECCFDNPADCFGETAIGFVQSLTQIKQKERERIIFETRFFSTTCFRSRRLQFWQTKRKLFNKKGHLVSLKVQKSKMLIKVQKLFSEDLFPSSKSSYEQVESSTDYPAGKVLSKGQKFVAQSSTLIKNSSSFSHFFLTK